MFVIKWELFESVLNCEKILIKLELKCKYKLIIYTYIMHIKHYGIPL